MSFDVYVEVGDDGDCFRLELAECNSDLDRQVGVFSLVFDIVLTYFDGPAFDWNKYVVYDNGLTPDDLAAAVRGLSWLPR